MYGCHPTSLPPAHGKRSRQYLALVPPRSHVLSFTWESASPPFMLEPCGHRYAVTLQLKDVAHVALSGPLQASTPKRSPISSRR